MAREVVSEGDAKINRLGQLKLLVAFDALLREGSVSRAAADMGLPTSSMSRILQQLREKYRDPLFNRTGQGLIPTPFAESIRLRIRALAAEADNLTERPNLKSVISTADQITGWEGAALIKAPPLAARPSIMLEGQPTPDNIARNLAGIGHNAEPQRRLAKYIATAGMGARQSRPLDQEEAKDALSIIMAGEADPIQIGALLATMQYRGATAAELAGFIEAIWQHIGEHPVSTPRVDLDWPAYISPKHRDAPWFLHSVRLVVMAGYRVMLHGYMGEGPSGGKLELAAQSSGIPVCHSLKEASTAITDHNVAFLPIGGISPQFQRLLGLYDLVEMRLPLNTIVHLINPLGAKNCMLGIARPAYRELHRDIARLLKISNITILGSTRDFAQFTPYRNTSIFGLTNGDDVEVTVPARSAPPAEMPTMFTSREYWQAVWTGGAYDERAETIIISTAAVALMAIDGLSLSFDEAFERSQRLWRDRDRSMAYLC